MFDWLEDLLEGLAELLEDAFTGIGEAIAEVIWDTMLRWLYNTIFGALADFFEEINSLTVDMFRLGWIQAAVRLFGLFGWALFVAGIVVAIFDVAIEYQHGGRANFQSCALNILKGFFAVNLFTVVPIELYKFCVSLQNTFAHDLIDAFISTQASRDYMTLVQETFEYVFNNITGVQGLLTLIYLICFGYCVVKLFFQNIKRGGILLVQIAIGSLYMFSVPRGYTDGFNSWMKQVIALCVTAFMQTTLMYLGLLTMTDSLVLGLGIMLSANEVPRIADRFGFDTAGPSKISISSAVHTTYTAVNLAKIVGKAGK